MTAYNGPVIREGAKIIDGDMIAVPIELLEDVKYHLQCFDTSSSRTNAGHHLNELGDRVFQLSTWHPGYDFSTGTLPYEREDQE